MILHVLDRASWRRAGSTALVLAVVVAGVMLCTRVASAHAGLVSSNPTDKQVLASSPAAVTLSFTENASPAPGSFIRVSGGGKDASAGPSSVSKTDTKTVSIPLQANLPAGQYDVFWKSTSADDGGVTFGHYSFFVGQPDPNDVAKAASGVSVAVPDAAKNDALSGGKGSSNTGYIVGIIVAAIAGVVVGGGVIALVRGRAR